MLRLEIPDEVQDELRRGAQILVSVSGGKDSTATALLLKENDIDYKAVTMDTGWEHKILYSYVDNDLPEYIGPITKLRAVVDLPPALEARAKYYEERLGLDYSPMVRLILLKGLFPSRKKKWCTEALKLIPFQNYTRGLEYDIVSTLGIRAQESYRRGQMPVVEFSKGHDGYVWRPILRWTYRDVIDIHQRHGVTPCPLYFAPMNAERVGCWPCINSRKGEIMRWSKDELRVSVLAELEEEVMHLQVAKIKNRGEELELNWQPPAFFYGKGGIGHTPIREAVQWSLGPNTENQAELFADESSGCVRWGMCDARSER